MFLAGFKNCLGNVSSSYFTTLKYRLSSSKKAFFLWNSFSVSFLTAMRPLQPRPLKFSSLRDYCFARFCFSPTGRLLNSETFEHFLWGRQKIQTDCNTVNGKIILPFLQYSGKVAIHKMKNRTKFLSKYYVVSGLWKCGMQIKTSCIQA